MARLTKGWSRLKTVGEVSPMLILVNRNSGKFGTSIDEGETIREWATMAEAEQFVKDANEVDAINVVYADSTIGDHVLNISAIRVRKAGRDWLKIDGTRIHSYYLDKYRIPNPDTLAKIDALREQHEALRKQMSDLRSQAWDLVRSMEKLESNQ